MKNKCFLIICIISSLFLLQSCSNHQPAPVIDLSKSNNSKKSQSSSNKTSRSKDFVKVKKGDTLYSIGFINDIDYKKIAILNNIKPPYRIYPGQILKLKGNVTILTKIAEPKTQSSGVKTSPVNTQTFKPTPKVAPADNNTAVSNKVVTETPKVNSPIQKQPEQTKAIQKQPEPKPIVSTKPNITPSSNSEWIWPAKGRLYSSFSSSDTSRKGIKIAVPLDSSVYASNNGMVVYSGDGLRGYGELIIIKHSDNLLSAYAHNSKRFVKEGETVKQGQEIAKSGTGNDGKALLHFEIRKNGQPVNPVNYLPK